MLISAVLTNTCQSPGAYIFEIIFIDKKVFVNFRDFVFWIFQSLSFVQLCLLRIYILSKSHFLVSSSTEFVFYRTSIPMLSCFVLICFVLQQKIPTQYYTCLSLCRQMSKATRICDTRIVEESKVVLFYLYSLIYWYQGSTSKLFLKVLYHSQF